MEGQETEQAIGTTEERGRPKRIIRMPARFNDWMGRLSEEGC